MNSSMDVHTPQPFKINGLWQFQPETIFREGESDPPPLGPFKVLGDYKLERVGRPVQRFLIIQPQEGSKLPTYNEYVLEYPEKLIAGHIVTFECKGSAHRIKAQLTQLPGCISLCHLRLKNENLTLRDYVLYEEQVEGTWIPIEADGKVLKP